MLFAIQMKFTAYFSPFLEETACKEGNFSEEKDHSGPRLLHRSTEDIVPSSFFEYHQPYC
jgi:hypothetical protein